MGFSFSAEEITFSWSGLGIFVFFRVVATSLYIASLTYSWAYSLSWVALFWGSVVTAFGLGAFFLSGDVRDSIQEEADPEIWKLYFNIPLSILNTGIFVYGGFTALAILYVGYSGAVIAMDIIVDATN
jgi:hypothetical protein